MKAVLSTRLGAAGREIKRAEPGTTVRVVGRGFGEDPAAVSVLFDDLEAPPFRTPFSDGELLVTCPLPERPSDTLRVRVGDAVSNEVPLAVRRPSRGEDPPGSATRAYFQALDEAAALTAALGRRLAPDTPLAEELRQAADRLDAARRLPARFLEVYMQLLPGQQEQSFEPYRTIELLDEIIVLGEFTEGLRGQFGTIFGPEGPVAAMASDAGVAEFLFGSSPGVGGPELAERAASDWLPSGADVLDWLGFGLHEGAKTAEGIENFLKVAKPSAEAGGSAGAHGAVDVELDPGEIVSGIAKLVDVLAQLLQKISSTISSSARGETIGGIKEGVDKLEMKSDTHGTAIGNLEIWTRDILQEMGQAEAKLDRQEQALERVEEGVEKAEGKLDRLEGKADIHSGQLESLEAKADRQTEKLDQLEQKADRAEQKLDSLEAKADRADEKLDQLESKGDKAEGKLDKLESKADQAEGKLDSLEAKADQAEGKLDSLEAKADRAEGKLDLLEPKADQAEAKLDGLEAKADMAEGKLDQIEAKLDQLEGKIDREEQKLDRLALPPPHEGSVANQRGGGDHVTGAVAAVRGLGNEVSLSAAIDVERVELDDASRWSPWVSFGAPSPLLRVLSVSIDLQYEEGSDTVINALLTAREATGAIYRRTYEGGDHGALLDPDEWSDWEALP